MKSSWKLPIRYGGLFSGDLSMDNDRGNIIFPLSP